MLYVANWKLFLSHQQSLDWCLAHGSALAKLTKQNPENQIVLCPTASVLAQIKTQLDSSKIELGAQNCSDQINGAYTGEISAQSLQEIGVKFCIIGHSERRNLYNETPNHVAQKAVLLLQYKITPIVCVSDDIKKELVPVLQLLAQQKQSAPIIVAYEPVSAIGSGTPATNNEIMQALENIQTLCNKLLPTTPISLLYGGSVNPKNIQQLKSIPLLDGFLIGKASTDFTKLQKIVELK